MLLLSCAQVEAAEEGARPARQILVMLHLPAAHFRPDSSYGGGYPNDISSHARLTIAQAVADQYHLTLVSRWPMSTLEVDCFVMTLPDGMSMEDTVKQVSADSRIEWAQEINVFATLGEAADPLYPIQPSATFWHLDQLHTVSTGKGVRIAVIDSGVEDDHPDLLGQVSARENFVLDHAYVAETHGTAVAGIIVAVKGNRVGIAGIAPDAKIMALRACWQDVGKSMCNSFTIGQALNFAILNGAKVVNMSFAGPKDQLLKRLIEVAQQRGMLIVAAATGAQADGGFPASLPGVFAVADKMSSSRPASTLYAPGQDIPTTAPHFSWTLVSGSSFSAAHVSGLAALLLQLRPKDTQEQIRQSVLTKSTYISGAGSGNIEVCATFRKLVERCICECQ
ncbi:serine protease [Herbaspirillum rubrisubalbicans]|uniref:Serine protease n=2 Tax=Herbaspirillum rubrisubalbicans TaxID=80842 RepID=A0ABX9BY49_9BURK|nr:S8 family serine peptidase [Herbaspirillum rubrisubalbicans]NQE50724.1 serine protease [Herbaspirillum rubrisubalbicans]RAM62840.1 serine protease [Herbaspirillum rubrisubalbicans]RAN49272.1 serine protease [Herbaspirillum rubrisubalbicans]